jgi:membrane protein YqaA with SNARE-associated domain
MNAPFSRLTRIQRYLDRPWYPLLLAGLAALDLIVVVIPIDGLTVAAVLAAPRRWLQYAIAAATGNILGCGVLAQAVYQNAGWIHDRLASWMDSSAWASVEHFIQSNGSWSIALGALSPIPLQLWVIVPALAKMPAQELFFALLAGRFVRSVALCWVASHTPRLLSRSRGIMRELQEARAESDDTDTR